MPSPRFNLDGAEKLRAPWSIRQNLISMLIWIAGFDEHILRQHCPRYEYGVAIAIGCVAVIVMILNASLSALAGHALFGASQLSFGIVVIAAIFALTIATVDSYGGHTQHISGGAKGLRDSGLSFSRLMHYIRSLSPFGTYRAIIALLTALVTTTGVCLQWYAPDITARQNQTLRDGNHPIYQQAEQAYEQGSKRLSDAEASQSALVADLEREDKRLRQEVVRRSVAGARRDSVAASPIDRAQLDKFEKRLADEKSKLVGLREQSLKRVEGRNAAVTQMIATSPEKAQRQDGVIGRLTTLHEILADNPGALVIVVAIDLLLSLVDCAGFAVRLCAPSSVYAAYVAKSHILESVGQAKDCADQLARYEREPRPDLAGNPPEPPRAAPFAGRPPDPPTPSNDNHEQANDNQPLTGIVSGATPPHRGPGRPLGSKNRLPKARAPKIATGKSGLNGGAQEPSP